MNKEKPKMTEFRKLVLSRKYIVRNAVALLFLLAALGYNHADGWSYGIAIGMYAVLVVIFDYILWRVSYTSQKKAG